MRDRGRKCVNYKALTIKLSKTEQRSTGGCIDVDYTLFSFPAFASQVFHTQLQFWTLDTQQQPQQQHNTTIIIATPNSGEVHGGKMHGPRGMGEQHRDPHATAHADA